MTPKKRSMASEEMHQANIFHKVNSDKCRRRLDTLYGLVAREQNRDIAAVIEGKDVLDVGAGYGVLTRQLMED